MPFSQASCVGSIFVPEDFLLSDFIDAGIDAHKLIFCATNIGEGGIAARYKQFFQVE